MFVQHLYFIDKNLEGNKRYYVSVLGRDEGYTVKYNPLPEGVPEGEARENSFISF